MLEINARPYSCGTLASLERIHDIGVEEPLREERRQWEEEQEMKSLELEAQAWKELYPDMCDEDCD